MSEERRRGRLVALMGAVAAIVAVGTGSLWALGGSSGHVGRDTYRILQLFVFDGDWVFESDTNTIVRVLAFVAPLVTIVGVLEIMGRQVLRAARRWRVLWRARGHTVIVGLTTDSLRVVEVLAARRQRLVVLDPDPGPAGEARCDRLGVPVLRGAPAGTALLAQARLADARRAISFLADADAQMAFVLAASGSVEARRQRGPRAEMTQDSLGIDLWLRLHDASVAERLAAYAKFGVVSAHVHPRFFTPDEIGARQLLRRHPLDVYADAFGQTRIHLAVYGCGAAGEAVIAEAARQCVTLADAPLRVTVFDRDPQACRIRIEARYPQIHQVVQVAFEPLVLQASGFAPGDYTRLPADVTAHVIALPRDDDALAAALSLRRLLLAPPDDGDTSDRRLNAPVFVRLHRKRGLAWLLRSNVDRAAGDPVEPEVPDGLFAFGSDEETGDPDAIADETREDLARSIHGSYRRSRAQLEDLYRELRRDSRPAEREWNALEHGYRESSRQAADHIWVKARAVRCRVVDAAGTGDPVEPAGRALFTDVEIPRLARLEHRRWGAERLMAGWTYGSPRVDAVRRHPLLVAWEDLPAHERDLDYGQILTIPSALARVGRAMRRALVVGVLAPQGAASEEAPPSVCAAIEAALVGLLARHPEAAPVLVTRLASPPEMAAADIARRLEIPYIAMLPLPFELAREDFGRGAAGMTRALRRYFDLVAASERYIELPLRFGPATALTIERTDPTMHEGRRARVLRTRQHLLAAAHVVERADVLIAVDAIGAAEEEPRLGGPIDWWTAGAVPAAYATPEVFLARAVPGRRELIPIAASDPEAPAVTA